MVQFLGSTIHILFRLALYETEPSIGNNSTVVWQSLFWPVLAGTEVAFNQRLPILLRRLRSANIEELPLILSAAFGCVEYRNLGLPAPPRVVGGRVVPPPWRPRTWGEIAALRREAGLQILDAINGLPGDCMPAALSVVAEHLRDFLGLGLLDHLRTLFRPDRVVEPLRHRLAAELEEWIAFLRETGQRDSAEPTLRPFEEWLAEWLPMDLAGQVRNLTAQDYWPTWNREERDGRYSYLADELIASPETFRSLADWFTATEARAADSLGLWLGRRDEYGRLSDIVRDWLQADCCRAVVIGYLQGIAAREGSLPDQWAATLNALAANQPEPVAIATGSADVSSRGFERVLGLLDRLPAPASRFLRPLAFSDWLWLLDAGQRTRAAEELVRLADAGDSTATAVGLDLIQMWAQVDPSAINPPLTGLALNLASRPLGNLHHRDLHPWKEVLRLLCPFYPRQVAELVVGRITEPSGSLMWDVDEGVEVLIRAAAVDPAAVMEAVGDAVLVRDRRVIFGVAVFEGLFEAIGLQHVTEWLERHGREHLRWLARHFPSPHLDETGQPVVPMLTEWLFRENESDNEAFSCFLMGRHSSGMISERDVDPARRAQQMRPFLGHDLRRVREWAEYEVQHEERMAKFFRDMDEEDERR